MTFAASPRSQPSDDPISRAERARGVARRPMPHSQASSVSRRGAHLDPGRWPRRGLADAHRRTNGCSAAPRPSARTHPLRPVLRPSPRCRAADEHPLQRRGPGKSARPLPSPLPRLEFPTVVHLHGGAFVMGGKSIEARPLLYQLASQGWICISANYRLRPRATLSDQLIGRQEGARLGAPVRSRVRRRPGCRLGSGQLRRRSPGCGRCSHTQRGGLAARVRRCRHLGCRRDLPVRLLRLL
jgi:hypothetical protein